VTDWEETFTANRFISGYAVQLNGNVWGKRCIAKRIFSGHIVQRSGNEWEETCCLRVSLVDLHFREVGMTGKNLYIY
jgi:hypothetical protein